MEKRILITGAAGYIGSLLGNALAKDFYVVGTDIRTRDDVDFPIVEQDIRDPAILELLREHDITHVVHLASILESSDNPERDYDIDVNGTRNVLQACVAHGVRHITVSSSGAAYGYHADNPDWIDEDDALRGNDEVVYAKHKRLIEAEFAEYRETHPELLQLILRPGTVLGGNTGNLITNLFQKKRILAIQGSDSPFIFIWDEDVVEVMRLGIVHDRSGRYNLAGDGALRIDEIAAILDKKLLRIPAPLLRAVLAVAKKLKVGRYGPEQVAFLQYRPVLSNRRLKEEFGYTPKKTSEETFLYFLENARQRGEL